MLFDLIVGLIIVCLLSVHDSHSQSHAELEIAVAVIESDKGDP